MGQLPHQHIRLPMIAWSQVRPRPEQRHAPTTRDIDCPFCGTLLRVPVRAINTRCTGCQKHLRLEDVVVRGDSPLQKVADADAAGVHIVAVKNDTQDVYLSAHLKNTRVDTVATMPALEEIESSLISGKMDAFAANRQRLMEAAARYPKLRVLGDNYFVAGQAVALAKGDAERLGTLNKMLGEVLATGLVKTSIERAGLLGVEAAAPLGR